MIELLDAYDWEQAFLYADAPTPVPPGADVARGAILRENIVGINWSAEGENEGPSWLIGGELADGRWFFLSAGCDYTGWDCQASGNAYVAADKDTIVRFGMGDGERDRLGLLLEGEKRIKDSWEL